MDDEHGSGPTDGEDEAEMVGLSDFVAEHQEELGVRLSAVTNWRNRFYDFPRPQGESRRPQMFLKSELIDWARRHDKWRSPDDQLDPRPVAIAHRELQRAGISDEDHTLALGIAAYALVESPRPGSSTTRTTKKPSRRPSGDTSGHSDTVQPVTDAMARLDPPAHQRIMAALADHGSTPMSLRAEFAELTGDRGFLDDPLTGKILVAAVQHGPTINDPCCGSGLLLSLIEENAPPGSPHHLSGSEIDAGLAAAADLLLTANGIPAEITCENSLAMAEATGAVGPRFDTVIADPPAEAPETDDDGPVVRPSEWTGRWVTTVMDRLANGGSAGLVVPTRWMMARGGHAASTRRRLLDAGLIEAVIRVPTPTRNRRVGTTVVLVLRGTDLAAERDVLVIDIFSDRPPRQWDDEDDEDRATVDAVLRIMSDWRAAADTTVPSSDQPAIHVSTVAVSTARAGYFFDLDDHAAGPAVRETEPGGTSAPTRTPPASTSRSKAMRIAPAHTFADLVGQRLVVVTGRDPQKELPPGTGKVIVLQTSGQSFGSVDIVEPDMVPKKSRGIAVFALSDPTDDELPLGFLAAWLSSVENQEHLRTLGAGGSRGSRSVAHGAVLRLSAEFPPVDDRRRIAKAWDTLEEEDQRLRDLLHENAVTRRSLITHS